jgi:hypothetical protein
LEFFLCGFYKDAAPTALGQAGFEAHANGGKRFAPGDRTRGNQRIYRRRATAENSPQFQLRVVMLKTDQAPAGRPENGGRFGRPAGTVFDLACETRS